MPGLTLDYAGRDKFLSYLLSMVNHSGCVVVVVVVVVEGEGNLLKSAIMVENGETTWCELFAHT